MTDRARQNRLALDRLGCAAKRLMRPATFMEVCGTHTVAVFRSGLHALMPSNVALLSGPGCPVCVTAQGDIDLLISAADVPGVVLCTYGDMIRVPGSQGNLEQARARGAQVRIVYSALDAVELAAAQPGKRIVFAAIGFETTAPATALAILQAQQRGLTNFLALASHKTILPAMHALLSGGQIRVDGFLLPGHVSVILGAEAFRPIVEQYHLPCVIAGFEDGQIAAALAQLTELTGAGKAELVNHYPQAVTSQGNRHAQAAIARVFQPADATWRGLGPIRQSGLVIRDEYRAYDAQATLGLKAADVPEPAGCRCGQVITGQTRPADCILFGTACTPVHPIGPCMVSSEGTCQAWFKYRRKDSGFRGQDPGTEKTELSSLNPEPQALSSPSSPCVVEEVTS